VCNFSGWFDPPRSGVPSVSLMVKSGTAHTLTPGLWHPHAHTQVQSSFRCCWREGTLQTLKSTPTSPPVTPFTPTHPPRQLTFVPGRAQLPCSGNSWGIFGGNIRVRPGMKLWKPSLISKEINSLVKIEERAWRPQAVKGQQCPPVKSQPCLFWTWIW
jgi:hypothetical protein